MNTIYTAGYAGWTPATLKREAERLGACVVDIRYSPHSRRPAWERAALQLLLGDAYRHEPALGNRNYRGGPIELAAPERALAPLGAMLARQPIVLLCGCRDWQTCHRRDAADYLAGRLDAPVEHLAPPAAPPRPRRTSSAVQLALPLEVPPAPGAPPDLPPDVPPELVAQLAAVGVTIAGVAWNAHFQEWEWTIERDRPWNARATHRLRWPLTMFLSGLVAVAARHAQEQ